MQAHKTPLLLWRNCLLCLSLILLETYICCWRYPTTTSVDFEPSSTFLTRTSSTVPSIFPVISSMQFLKVFFYYTNLRHLSTLRLERSRIQAEDWMRVCVLGTGQRALPIRGSREHSKLASRMLALGHSLKYTVSRKKRRPNCFFCNISYKIPMMPVKFGIPFPE